MNAASNSWSVYLQITTHHDDLRPSCQITFCHSLFFATCGMLPAGGLRLPCIHQVPCGPGKMQESVCDICLSYACKAANKMHCFTAYNTPLVLSIADPSSASIDTFLLACCTLSHSPPNPLLKSGLGGRDSGRMSRESWLIRGNQYNALQYSSPCSSSDLPCRLQLSQHVHFPVRMLHAFHILHQPPALQCLQYSGHLRKSHQVHIASAMQQIASRTMVLKSAHPS